MNAIKNYFMQLASHKSSAQWLAFSFAIGTYIAFSPYLGAHTLMVFVSCWLFKLDLTVTMAAAYLINNPWTAIPVYLFDYWVGYRIVHDLIPLPLFNANPYCIEWASNLIEHYLGMKLCFWSFLLGGNIVGIIAAIIAYPIMKFIFEAIIRVLPLNATTPKVMQ